MTNMNLERMKGQRLNDLEVDDKSEKNNVQGAVNLQSGEIDLNTHACLMDETLEDLDDVEYHIPSVLAPPTLESILYESDGGTLSDEEENGQMDATYDVGDCTSVASSSSIDLKPHEFDSRQRKSPHRRSRDSVLRHVVLRGISSQISSAVDRVNVGLPTAMTASSLIAIGTSHGIVLIFDGKQVLKWFLEYSSTEEQYGAVSSLCLNHNCSRLLCGYAKGQITMWDLNSGKLLRKITDCYPLGTAVLHIQFTDDPTLALCSDSGGSVFELTFKRVMTVRGCDSKCVFSGSHGEVIAMRVLNMVHLKSHPLQDVCIIALATLSKVIVISIRPLMKVLFTHPLKGHPSSLPILTWQFVIIQVSQKERVMDPVLAFGRGSVIYFFQITATAVEGIEFVPLQKMDVSANFINFLWFNPRTLAVLDTMEHLHVIDVKTQDTVEIYDLSDVQLVYGSSHFKGLSTGGNVSKAMAIAGEQSCYQSVTGYQGQILLLGTKSVHVVTLRSWNERIELLVKHYKYPEALSLALSFYEDKAMAVVGLTHHKERKKEILIHKMLDLIQKFVDYIISNVPDTRRQEAVEEHFLSTIPICTKYCLILGRHDLLFEKLYEIFSINEVAKNIFLESLEPYILNDSFHCIPPTVLKSFVLHYESRGYFDVLERCITHLNIETLDLHKVITLCRSHGMHDAIIYIFNKGMSDFGTPFEELMGMLQKEMKSGNSLSDNCIKIGNKVLVYTSFSLSGRAYPWGNIDCNKRDAVRTEMLRCLTVLHTRNAPDDEPTYPYLRTLLHFDTREILNVLALAFEEPEFNTDAGNLQKQRLFDILLQIMVDEDGFTPSEISPLFTFIARQMAKPNSPINFTRSVFEQVIEYLICPDGSRRAERQQVLLELLSAGCLDYIAESQLLLLVEKAGFFQICEILYEKRREYYKILSCYLLDPSRTNELFGFVENTMKGLELTDEEKSCFKNEVLKNIEAVIEIDNLNTAKMIIACFPELLKNVLENIQVTSKSLFKLLQGLHCIRDNNTKSSLDDIFLNYDLQKTYFQLMCVFEPDSAIAYVKSNDMLKVDAVLEIAQQYKLYNVVAYLMEEMGDVKGAFEIILQKLNEKVLELINCIPTTGFIINGDELMPYMKNITQELDVAIKFCQRNSCKVDDVQHEALWLSLLDAILLPLKKYCYQVSETFHSSFKDLTYHLLNSMMGYIQLTSVLQKMFQDPTYESSKFGEVKDFLLAVLDTYNYKKILLNSTKNLVNNDLHQAMLQQQMLAKRGFSSHCSTCDMCNKELQYGFINEAVLVFRCEHKFHERCLKQKERFREVDEKLWVCYICNK